jgi:hypothetical protein
MTEQLADVELLEDVPQATDVVTVRVGIDDQVNCGGAAPALDVLDKRLAVVAEPAVDDHDDLVVPRPGGGITQCDGVGVVGSPPRKTYPRSQPALDRR